MSKIKINKIDEVEIKPFSSVTVTEMNHIVEVQHMEKKNKVAHIRKLDRDRYVFLATGEIMEFEHKNHRGESLNSLRQTFKKLRYLINANFVGGANEIFVTLTFRGDLQTSDHKVVGKHYDSFLKRLKRKYKAISSIDAIRVLEPHASGNWHLHVLFRFNDLESIYIPVDQLAAIWKNGFVYVNRLKNVDNVGAYVSAYMTDIEVDEGFESDSLEVIEKQVDGERKRFAKGARLIFYPPGVNIYTCTRGVVMPDRIDMTYADLKEKVGAANPHFKKSIELTDSESDYKNTITYEQYNLKRL